MCNINIRKYKCGYNYNYYKCPKCSGSSSNCGKISNAFIINRFDNITCDRCVYVQQFQDTIENTIKHKSYFDARDEYHKESLNLFNKYKDNITCEEKFYDNI